MHDGHSATNSTLVHPGDNEDAQLNKFPAGSRLLNLREGSKVPASVHGHLDAKPRGEFVPSGTNVGFALDNAFLLVDIDHEEIDGARSLSERVCAMAPWEQQTPRGRHFVFRTPFGWKGRNVVLRGPDGTPFGDLKCNGYAVGPGSTVDGRTYTVVNPTEPPLAPQWLLDMATQASQRDEGQERPGVPYGEHDAFLVSVAGLYRRWGLSEGAIQQAIEDGPLAALDGYDDTRPFTERDFKRIAHSVARKPAGEEDNLEWLEPDILPATSLPLVGPPIEWIVNGFVPCGELVMLYGPGGIGKSSFGSWLGSIVSVRGKSFLYVGSEESNERFLGRAVLAGADLNRCYYAKRQYMFPDDADELVAAIRSASLDVVYIDAINNHFQHVEGLNAAEKARRALSPLASAAHDTGCTILGVFHENKAGTYLGSVEMVNVARCVLRASRRKEEDYLKVYVAKTNLRHPEKVLCLRGEEKVFTIDGKTQREVLEDGEVVDMTIVVPSRIADREDDSGETPMEFEQSELAMPEETCEQYIRRVVSPDSAPDAVALAEDCNWSERRIQEVLKKLRAEGYFSIARMSNADITFPIGKI